MSPARAKLLLWAAALACVAPPAAAPALAKDPPATKVDLAAEARSLAERWGKNLGQGYTTRIDSRRHIVYVSAVDPAAFAHVVKLLAAVHDAQATGLFPRRLRRNVTVILPTVKDYRRLVPNAKAHGIYTPRNRALVSISYSTVLVHEFIHALHHNDQVVARQNHPIWLIEGLAMLYQASVLKDGRFEVKDPGSLAGLQSVIKAGTVRPLKQLCRMTPKAFMASAESAYRQSHHVMLYLHRQGKLRAFYTTYKATYAQDPTGAKALAQTLGKPLDRVEADWRKWVLACKPPWRPAHARSAHLGIRMAKSDQGVEVSGFLRGSTAQRAGLLKGGDVIISLAGRPVRSARDLSAAVQACRPGQIVEIEIIRAGRTVMLKHRLGLAPK